MIGFGGGGRPFPTPRARHIAIIDSRIGERVVVGSYPCTVLKKNRDGNACVVRRHYDKAVIEVPHNRRVTIRGRNQ